MNGIPQSSTLQNTNAVNQSQLNRESSQNNPFIPSYQSPNNSQINHPSTSQVQANMSPVQNQNFNNMQLNSPNNSNIKPNFNDIIDTTDDEVVNQENTANFDLGIKFNMQI